MKVNKCILFWRICIFYFISFVVKNCVLCILNVSVTECSLTMIARVGEKLIGKHEM